MNSRVQRMVWSVVVSLIMGAAMTGAYAEAADKVVYVDLGVLFDNYQKTKDADASLTETANQKQKDRDVYVENIRRMKDEMVVLADTSDDKRKKQEEVDKQIKELQGFDEKLRAEMKKLRDENLKSIFDDLNTVITDFGAKKGYDMIIDSRMLAYKNEKLNVTDQVLKELNGKYKK